MLNLNCVICAELFTPSDDVRVTTCGHMFHYLCLRQWMERSKTCPQCRYKCNERNIYRLYFNVANIDVSNVDVASLQDQLDNCKLMIKTKEKSLIEADAEINQLKEMQKKCKKTITSLENKLKNADFAMLRYNEQLQILKTEVSVIDSLRNDNKKLQEDVHTMEGVNALITSSLDEAKNIANNESDPKILSLWVAILKKELRLSENKRRELRHSLKTVQMDLHKEIENKKKKEAHISQLESDNYRLNEKIKSLEACMNNNNNNNNKIVVNNEETNILSGTLYESCLDDTKHSLKRAATNTTSTDITSTILSSSISDAMIKIEESDSPYLKIKSSSVGLAPLLHKRQRISNIKLQTTNAITNKPMIFGNIYKTNRNLSQKCMLLRKPGCSNFVFNGFHAAHINPFENKSDNSSYDSGISIKQKMDLNDSPPQNNIKTNGSITKRLKSSCLRNF